MSYPMKKLLLVLLATFCAAISKAADYRRQDVFCAVQGDHQDIDNPKRQLPFKIQGKMNIVYVNDTGEVVKSSFTGWIPDSAAPIALPTDVLNRLNAGVFTAYAEKYVGYLGEFRLTIPELRGTDLLEILKHLGAPNVDNYDPFIYSDFLVSTNSSHRIERYQSPFKLDFHSGAGFRTEYKIQLHLPAEIKNGLSFHLELECFGKRWP